MSKTNPLLLPQFKIPFSKIKTEHIKPAVTKALTIAQERLENLVNSSEPRTFENTLVALEKVTEELSYSWGIVGHLKNVVNSEELREVHQELEPQVISFYTQLEIDSRILKALQDYASTSEATNLAGAEKRLLDKHLQSLKQNGAGLPDDQKEHLKAINDKLAKLTTKFANNALDALKKYELIITEEEQLSGLPESALEMAKAGAEAKGKEGWRFTLDFPSYYPALKYADNEELRKSLNLAYNQQASQGKLDNRSIIVDILKLRQEKAKLLGYKDFSDYVLEDRMAKKGLTAHKFVDDLVKKVRSFAEKEDQELVDFYNKLENKNVGYLDLWDVNYYAEKMRQANYDFDGEQLRPYFSLESVLEGMFEIVHRLYGIKVTELSANDKEFLETWNKDVRYFEIHDEKDKFLGGFYGDFFPRDDKRSGAWMDYLVAGGPYKNGTFKPHLGLICANVMPPVKEKPALLNHEEVETVFHEFGHLLHQLLSTVNSEYRSISGINVAWDFVELPSQIMENWCWEKEALDLFAKHYETGKNIPKELFQKMTSARNFRSSKTFMGQLCFGTVDLMLHRKYNPEKDEDVVKYAREITQSFSATPLSEDYARICSFGHLFANSIGYASAYYSYKWAEALDADAFSRFQEEGLFNREVGLKFRKLLSQGDSIDPMKLYLKFMGRKPNPEAMLHRAGLVE